MSAMENYTKGESRTIYDPPKLQMEGAVEMKVTNGSKIRNIMGFALSSMTNSNVRHMTWNGTGNAINKTISCVEIMKRKIKGLHQITQVGFLRVEDLWEPTLEGLDTLKVNTNIPAISILLSKDPLDLSNPSYQAPGTTDIVWTGVAEQSQGRQTGSKRKSAALKDVKTAASKPKWNTRDKKDGSKAPRKQTSSKKSDTAS
ncbi:unnamed protein product [Candidula unifasciata]|uniref:DNA/RNA-binding protein Alba-like domain-containing protein n=1 Tax=Candidula unifasciata TaxID=100452 RepID=A0A8S3ZWJ1_9EUPU|nr:unnamed protein product [Candidula unifasciata]